MRFATGLLVLVAPSLLFAQPPSSPVVIVDSVNITRDSSVSSQHLQEMEQGIRNHTYVLGRENVIAERANYELQKDGYFKAETTVKDVQVVSATPTARWVSVMLRSNEGQQYRLGHISFKNNKIFKSPQLRGAFQIADGDVFDVDKVRTGFEAIRRLYAEDGYINVTPVPQTGTDDEARTVDLIVDMDEGAQYTMGSIELESREEWPSDKAEKLLNIWRPHAEHAYDPEVIEQIQQEMLEMFPGITPEEALPAVQQNAERKTVNLSVSLPETVTSR